MTDTWSRTWTDARDGAEWKISYNPGVELEPKRVRDFRERLIFEGPAGTFDTPAAYGSAVDKLSDADLQGLLDQARQQARAERKGDAPGRTPG